MYKAAFCSFYCLPTRTLRDLEKSAISFPDTILQELSLLLTVLYSIMVFILGKYIYICYKQITNDTV